MSWRSDTLHAHGIYLVKIHARKFVDVVQLGIMAARAVQQHGNIGVYFAAMTCMIAILLRSKIAL